MIRRKRNIVQRAKGHAFFGAAAFWLAVLLIFGLFGCGQKAFESQQTGSIAPESASIVSDPLDLTENPLFESANRSVRITGGEPEILRFLKLYAEAITTLEPVDFSDICTDTAENAVMFEYIRYRIAFSRVEAQSRPNYKLVATETSREQNGDALTVIINFEESYDNEKTGKRSVSTGFEWAFVLDVSGDTRMITSVKELPPEFQGGGQWYVYFVNALQATGLPLETPEQVHTAGDEVIRCYYKNGTLPHKPTYLMADGEMPENAYTVALPYTDNYQLVCVTPGFSYGITHVGLADKDGRLIFDVNYKGISVTENGYFILRRDDFQRLYGDVYIVVGPDGVEVARYHDLSCYTVYEDGTEACYEASSYDNQPAAPYAAHKEYLDGTEEHWLLDENFNPIGESYDSLILFGEGATATKEGSLYNLDRTGTVVSKKETGVIQTFFGKYQLTIYYNSWYGGDVNYGLLDENGNTVFEQKYCYIGVPFEDRVVLYAGNMQGEECHTAQLADIGGNILNEKYNGITYIVTETGYIGIAQCCGEDAEAPVKDGEKGFWLVDKDGNTVSEKYQRVGNFINDLDGLLYINANDTTSPLMMQKEDGTVKTVPLEEILIPLH